MATERLGVNVSFHQYRSKTLFLGELPLGELSISRQSQSFTGLIESDRNWSCEIGQRFSCMYSDYMQLDLTRFTECGEHPRRYCSPPCFQQILHPCEQVDTD